MNNFDWKSLLYSVLLVVIRFVADSLEVENKRSVTRNMGVRFPEMEPEHDLPKEEELLSNDEIQK